MSLFSRISERLGLTIRDTDDEKENHGRPRQDPPSDLSLQNIPCIELPKSPQTWDIDGRKEFHEEYSKPGQREIYNASFAGQHSKVLKLSADLGDEQLSGPVGELVAKAYRETILKRTKAKQLLPAIRWAHEMLVRVPAHCTDTDRRRLNRLITEANKSKLKHSFETIAVPAVSSELLFEISEGSPWELEEVQALPADEKPDTELRLHGTVGGGFLYVDSIGRSQLANGKPGALRRIGKQGNLLAETSVDHRVFHLGTGASGSFLAIMDIDGFLHLYDGELHHVWQRDLQHDPRIKEHFRTTDTNYWGHFRSQVCAVDVNENGSQVLFTIADEAWCCDRNGKTIWGLRMPLKDGWERVTVRGNNELQPPANVVSALKVLELELPVDLEQIKMKRRMLAMKFHPDRNQGKPEAARRMQQINDAFVTLTGMDPSTFDVDVSDAAEKTGFQETDPMKFEAGGITFIISIGGIAQDWVYGAAFSSTGGAYLTTYSGKIIELSETGMPLFSYTIGQIADRIIDRGPYLYLLTRTRLYVVKKREGLLAHIDAFKQGCLVVMESGFGFLGDKKLQWFTPEGIKIGEVSARDPIRKLYADKSGFAVVETRKHRERIAGLKLDS